MQPLQALGRKNGEWYVIKLPTACKSASPKQVLEQLPIPPKWIEKMIRDDHVKKQGDRLSMRLFPEETPDFVAQWTDLNILYEDEFTLVVNKPVGLDIYPDTKEETGSLANLVAAYYIGTGQACRVRHIHRLDRYTTGPVLYAKNELAHYAYDRDMREKMIQRIYLAVVEGIVTDDRGTIDRPIGKDRHHASRRRVSHTGAAAVTQYEVVERFTDHTLVRLRLETGRTHQIRVHMSSLGHPLAGDKMYGGRQTLILRQALHGERLQFYHAWSGDLLEVEAPLPDELHELIQRLRQNRYT